METIKMLRVLLATLCVSTTLGRVVHDEFKPDLPDGQNILAWPLRLTVKVSKMILSSDVIEDVTFWRSNTSVRVDSNNGAVKYIKKMDFDQFTTQEFEIVPKTDKEDHVQLVCKPTYGLSGTYLTLGSDSVLPNLDDTDYTAVGTENITDIMAVRFEREKHENGKDMYHTIWAFNSNSEDPIWVPVRYEFKEFNNKLGSLIKHDLWEFTKFSTEFDDDDVFDVTKLGCLETNMVKLTPDSDAVTKELNFINTENPHHVDHVFNSFKNKFNRKYAHEAEHNERRSIFQENMRMIASTNRQNLGYKLGVNQFTDRTPEEIKRVLNLRRRPEGKTGTHPFPYTKETLDEIVENLPKNVDLRLEGLVTPVLNQEGCGSCWTFGTTAAVEGALTRVNGGNLMRLSNQALIDCAWGFGGSGCDGGSDNAAYEWMMKYGLPTEEEYGSYKDKEGFCRIANMTTLYPIKGYTDVTPFSSNALKVALFNHGPLSVSVEATNRFRSYSSGIFYEKDCGPLKLDHEMTLVGYGEQYGDLFWILKNSWGLNWGIDGYMLIAARDNNCGVATEPTYVII